MTTILVTGATGFIGRHLCAGLLDAGYAVRGAYRNSLPTADPDPRIEWVQAGELGPYTDWSFALGSVKYVVHLAALAHQVAVNEEDISADFYRVNTEGTRGLAKAIAERPSIERIVFVSSIKALPPSGTQSQDPESVYGRSKKLAEEAIETELRAAASDWCVLRPCLVYGPGNSGNMARLLRLINSGLPLPFASIQNRRSFIFVGNLVSAIVSCLNHPGASRKTFTVSDGEPVSTPELLEELSKLTGRRLRLFPLPMPVLKGVARCGDVIKYVTGVPVGWDSYSVARLCGSLIANCSDIHERTGWTPPFSKKQGLSITVQSYPMR
jgi:nucleoside-diphosphate-sugar epimerase